MKVVINPSYNYLDSFVKELPDSFSRKGELIYKGRNQIKVFEISGLRVVVKSFKIPHLINKIAYSFFRSSKAKRSYENTLEIQRRGFYVPNAIAYIETFRFGLLDKSYFVYEYCEYKRTFKEFDLRPGTFNKKTDILIAFAEYTAKMHESGIYQKDYSNGNILFQKTEQGIFFSLVDVNRIIFGDVTEEMAYKAFSRLCAGEEMLRIIARRYAEMRGFVVADFVKCVKYYNDQVMKPTPLEEWPPLEPDEE